MEKNFDKWNDSKKVLHVEGKHPFFHEREVWWCALGVNIGFEQDGTGENFDRPVLVVKKFNQESCFAVALTGRKREGKFHQYLGMVGEQEASAVLSQVRLIDAKRFIRKIGTLDEKMSLLLKRRMRKVLFGL